MKESGKEGRRLRGREQEWVIGAVRVEAARDGGKQGMEREIK